MPFDSDKQRKGFFGSQPLQGSQYQQRSTTTEEKKHLFHKVLNYSKNRNIKHEEQERVKARNQTIREKKQKELEDALKERQSNIELEKQLLQDLKDKKIDPKELAVLTDVNDKKVLPNLNSAKQNELANARRKENIQDEIVGIRESMLKSQKILNSTTVEGERKNIERSIQGQKDLIDTLQKTKDSIQNISDPELQQIIKNISQQERDFERFRSPNPIFPMGGQHKRYNPVTGELDSTLTLRELYKNQNFIGIIDGKPMFKSPEIVPEEPPKTPEVKKDEPDGDKKKDEKELPYARLSPYLYSDE